MTCVADTRSLKNLVLNLDIKATILNNPNPISLGGELTVVCPVGYKIKRGKPDKLKCEQLISTMAASFTNNRGVSCVAGALIHNAHLDRNAL